MCVCENFMKEREEDASLKVRSGGEIHCHSHTGTGEGHTE